MGTVGIVANPASGKDIRRLVARASVFDNQEKQAIVRRVLAGIHNTADEVRIAYLDDAHGIVRGAVADLPAEDRQRSRVIAETCTGNALDTVAAGRALQNEDAAVVVTLGGDGTNRALCKGWQQATLIPISTGTNNVFPVLVEATVAGAAAGLIAAGIVSIYEATTQRKIISVDIDNESPDIALIDAVFVAERFVGSRALLNPENLKSALLTVADPSAVGMTAIAGLIEPLSDKVDHGTLLTFGDGTCVRAPIAPGYYRDIGISAHKHVSFSHTVVCEGPGVLAFDGERERVLKPGQQARLSISRDGPRVVDIPACMQLAAKRRTYQSKSGVSNAH